MTTPAVPVVRDIADLRERFGPEWTFRRRHFRSRCKWTIEAHLVWTATYWEREGDTEAEAAQALAERLIAAGYPPKEE